MTLPRLSSGMIVKLAAVAAATVVLAWLLLRGVDVRGLAETAIEWLREAGPWVFFAAMAVLPAVGAPLSIFTLVAGPAFGLAVSLPAAAVAMAVNMTLNYWIARRWLRPLVEWFFRHTHYTVPRSSAGSHFILTILVRVAFGLPYFAQGFILGLAEVPFRIYLPVSFAIQYAFAVGFIVFGDALMRGRTGMILVGVCILIAAALVVKFLRIRYARRDTTAV